LDAEIAIILSVADTNAEDYGIEIKLNKGESHAPFFHRTVNTVKKRQCYY